MKKIVFFDIDGTIYHYKSGVIEDTKNAIQELRENGHLAFLCTGRTEAMITSDILTIDFDGIIAGAGTYVKYGDRQIYRRDLDISLAREAVDTLRECDYMPIGEGHDYMYFEEEEKIVPQYKHAYDIYMKMIPDKIRTITDNNVIEVAKVSAAMKEGSDSSKLMKKLGDRFTCVIHDGGLMELIPKGHSKAYGIKMLLDELKIDRENTYAFGDSFNDLEMLEFVEYGIAMGNSSKGLFDKVKYKTGDYDKGGIREGLTRFGLIK